MKALETKKSTYQLPKPIEIAPYPDWTPHSDTADFWLGLTGNSGDLRTEDFFDSQNNLTTPPSETKWFWRGRLLIEPIIGPIEILSQSPENLLHPSWIGVQDTLRIYSLGSEDYKNLIKKLREKNIDATSLASGIGVLVKRKISAFEKAFDDQGNPIVRESSDKTQYVFLVDSSALRKPIEALHLVDEIRRLHPQTAKTLYSHLLIKGKIALRNARVWKEAISQYPNQEIPDYLYDSFNQAKDYVTAIEKELSEFVSKAQKRLGQNSTPLPSFLQEEVLQNSFFFQPQKKLEIEETIRKIANRAETRYSHLSPEERQKRIKKLVEYLIKRSFRENLLVTSTLTERINADPKQWLFEEVAIRGKEVLLDNLTPSVGMFEYLANKDGDIRAKVDGWRRKNNKPETYSLTPNEWAEATGISSVRAWLERGGFAKEINELKNQLEQALKTPLTEAQESLYYQKETEIMEKIISLMETYKGTVDHPVLKHFSMIETLINQVEDEEVKNKLKALWEAKKAIGQKQKYLTDLFLVITSHVIEPGKGYSGWSKFKSGMRDILESSPYFISIFGELNCVGRMILVSSMLNEAGIFSEENLVTLGTYKHSFLGGFDIFGVGRVIEPSGSLFHSYYGFPKRKIFEGKVMEEDEIIFQFPIKVGLITDVATNYYNLTNNSIALKILNTLLELTNFLKDSFWNNLASFCFKQNPTSLDWSIIISRAGAINDRYHKPFYSLLLENEFYQNFISSLCSALENETLKPLMPFLKLNLLAMKRTLIDQGKIKRIKKRIELPKDEDGFMIKNPDMEKMKLNLEQALARLSDVNLPFGLPDDPSQWANYIRTNPDRLQISNEARKRIESMGEEEVIRLLLWNPNLFPKPHLNEKGKISWEIPDY